LQRVYDDDEDGQGDEETKEVEEAHKADDPLTIVKEAYKFGVEALKLFYDSEHVNDKIEVSKNILFIRK